MKLNQEALKDHTQWEHTGIRLFTYDREAVKTETQKNPVWVHFGYGNIFRAFLANLQQTLLEKKLADTGIIAAEGFDYEIVDLMNSIHNDLTLSVTLKSDGSIDKSIIGSVVESRKLDSENTSDFSRMKEIFRSPSLQMCTFTITEKGYNLFDPSGRYRGDVAADMANGPQKPDSYIGKVAALCYERYIAGALPLALVSTDNCSHNGDKLRAAILAYAENWEKSALVESGYCEYLNNPDKISFPWSMIDKITPRPDDSVKQMLSECGFDDIENIRTKKNSFVAPFVNSEETEYLVIEDHFPNGRPPLEKANVMFTTRETVDNVERMKVCTCLNPLHTALAIYGCLLGFTKINDEMKDEDLKKLVHLIGYKEGLPVVIDPGILNPKDFLDTVLNIRLPNPFMPDTPQRIAMDTSQKLAIRFGHTIQSYYNSDSLDVSKLIGIPLVIAGWCRYLMGIDDNGNSFTVSPDPLYEDVSASLRILSLGKIYDVHELLGPLLSRSDIFGIDLYKAGLGSKIENLFQSLTAGTGAIRKTLHDTVISAVF